MTTSGTYNFNLSYADIVLEAYDRLEIRPPAITAEHMVSARRSLNLELQSWANRGINLWEVDEQQIPLQQGITTYNIDLATVNMLDTYLRTIQLPTEFNVTPNFSTVINTPTVTVAIANHGLQPTFWIQFVTPIAVGGLLLQGFYQVATVTGVNTFTITAASNATSTVNNGGALPLFSTIATSGVVGVTLANHGLVAGQMFNVGAQSPVGGIILFGAYQVSGVTSSSQFAISTATPAFTTTTAYEASGYCQINAQSNTVDPIDRILTPIGRTDYAMIPDKFVQTIPTLYWFDRTINPSVTIWPVPDGNGPYVLYYYRMRRIQDASPTMGQTADVPYRFLDALCAGMAARLATKYAKAMLEVLGPAAKESWIEAITEDRERAEISIRPNLSQYWRL